MTSPVAVTVVQPDVFVSVQVTDASVMAGPMRASASVLTIVVVEPLPIAAMPPPPLSMSVTASASLVAFTLRLPTVREAPLSTTADVLVAVVFVPMRAVAAMSLMSAMPPLPELTWASAFWTTEEATMTAPVTEMVASPMRASAEPVMSAVARSTPIATNPTV